MIKFCALNESASSDEEDDAPALATREAQEEEAYSFYNKALKFRSEGKTSLSENLFKEVLAKEFVIQAKSYDDKNKGPLRPALTLKYLVYKNLASIACEKKDYHASMEAYLEAMNIDATDVSMWYQMGLVALNLPNFPLARLCFEEGIRVNPNHWPCLDKIITVMYTLNDYANCLFYISKTLEKECSYLKGLAFKDKIFKEDPSLKSFCEGYFKNCDPSIHTAVYDKDEGYKFIQESLDMRAKKRSLIKSAPLPILPLKYPFKELTWKTVGESLVQMYDFVTSSDPFISLACKIDLSQYLETSVKSQEVLECEKVNSPANFSSSSEACSRAPSPGSIPTSQSFQPQACLLPASAHQQIEQDQLMTAGESHVEMEVDNVATGCVVSVYTTTTTAAQTDIKNAEPGINVDAPLNNGSRTPKRKRLLAELSEFGAKRRSARVRNTGTKRPQDNVNYQELLQKFLPSSLLADGKFDEQDDESEVVSQDKNSGDHTYGQTLNYGLGDQSRDMSHHKKLCSSEKEDVCDYIVSNQNNGGILDLLYKYVVQVSSRSSLVWPKGLCDTYCQAYVRLRKHIVLPNLFCHEIGNKYIKEQGMAVVVFSELKVDQWYTNTGHPSSVSPSYCPKLSSAASLFHNGREEIGQNFHADIEFLLQLTVRHDVLGSDWLEFTARILWLKAKFHSIEGEVDLAVNCMERLTDMLQAERECAMKTVVPNCSFTNVISLDNVQQQLESLQRCQSLEEVQRLYDHGDYSAVVELLIVTFTQPRAKSKAPGDGGIPERHAQLMLLQDSLWKLENYQECVRWSEVSFNEAIQQFMNASTVAARADWSDTMNSLLTGLDRCIKVDKDALASLEEFRLVRLTQNLIGVICLQMESCDFSSEFQSLFTVLPWILLYRIIYHEECKIKALAEKSAEQDHNSNQAIFEDISVGENDCAFSTKNKPSSVPLELNTGMPSSLMLLFTAHEYLGRRSWCCMSDGALLLLSVDVMTDELYSYPGTVQHPYHEDLSVGLEQCFYCLYGHPNKRTKAKHLQEHNSQQITLTWERAGPVFKYFKPVFLPEFDSYRTSTVSAELENLLRRISLLLPPDEDPTSRIDAYTAYIEGGIDKCPTLSPDQPLPSFITKDVYYLLGDYYFKSKEFSKAIRFYLLDIAVNPNRLDSWAGMALSRSSQLDQKLCSYELKKEATVYRKSSAALRCFEHALELDPTITSLWIEYGSLAYILHSHASRQLKQDGFGEDIQELLKSKKQEMLNVARQCFTAANRYEEEGSEPEELWLHHYMLGKIAEKWEKDPKIYLPHYQRALNHLHADNARYPRKIQYHNPPELSIEALEVYYRIHASCLKYLMKYEETGLLSDTLKLVHSCIKDVSSGPFANFQESQKTESQESSLSSSEAEEAPIPESASDEKYTTDHDYYGEEKKVESLAIELHSYVKKDHEFSVDSQLGVDSVVREMLASIVGAISENHTLSSSDNNFAVLLDDKKSSELTSHNTKTEFDVKNDNLNEGSNDLGPSQNFLNSEPVEIDKTDNFVRNKENILQDSIVEEKSIVCEIVTELPEVHSCVLDMDGKEIMFSKPSEQMCVEYKDSPLSVGDVRRSIDEAYKWNTNKQMECNVISQGALKKEIDEIFLDSHKRLLSDGDIQDIDKGAKIDADVSCVIDHILCRVESMCDEVTVSSGSSDVQIVAEVTNEQRPGNLRKSTNCEVQNEESDCENFSKMNISGPTWPKTLQLPQNIGENEMEKSHEIPNQKKSDQFEEKKDPVLCHLPGRSTPPDGTSISLKIEDSIKMEELEYSNKMLEESKLEVEELINACLNAMRECLQRYIQHFKSLYRMASYYCHSTKHKNLQWAREILLAATPSVNGYPSLPGLFADRKNTNFFNGIWRVPSNEIDRAGSFGAHMYRSVLLLIEVLWKQSDYNMLLYLTQQLHRTPDFGKKYMRDTDRTSLAKEAYDRCLTILRDQMNSLLQEEPPPEESRLTRCLLEIYRTCQTLLKAGIYPDETQEVLEEAYCMYKIGEVDPYPSVLDQAIKFCQLQLAKSYPPSHETSRYSNSSKQPSFAGDILGEGNTSTVSTTSNCYTPDAWQREFAKSLMLSIFPAEGNMKPELQLSVDPVVGVGVPVDNKQCIKASDSCHIKAAQQPSGGTTQVVHVEKPRAENLRACSVAFLPVAPVFPLDKSTLPTTVVPKNSSTLLSCQTFECYDIFTSLMQASGYHVTSLTTPQPNSDASSMQNITDKLQDPHCTQAGVSSSAPKRTWRNWSNKPSKQTVVSSSVSQIQPTVKADLVKEESVDCKLEIDTNAEVATEKEAVLNDSPEHAAI